jgi:hypothetical protein
MQPPITFNTILLLAVFQAQCFQLLGAEIWQYSNVSCALTVEESVVGFIGYSFFDHVAREYSYIRKRKCEIRSIIKGRRKEET